jgi:quinolinate synthase
MLDFYDNNQSTKSHLPLISKDELSDQEVLHELDRIKLELKDEVVVLGHHYQQDDIIKYADHIGDSLALAKKGITLNKPYIIFCGVHFMAETADILSQSNQSIILPDPNAGCSMADMAELKDIEQAWDYLTAISNEKIIPVTYINCSAELKSFVGKHGGSICTSSNAEQVIQWAQEQGGKLLFFPDQHLGRNTCFKMGVPLEKMNIYNPTKRNGGISPQEVINSKVILWHGYCSVHQGFTPTQVKNIKSDSPETTVIVHPECSFEVVQAADLSGSTSYILDTIEKAPSGSKFAVGTEINLVNRLNNQFPDKEIYSLSPYQCLCTTMYRVRPRWLLSAYQAIKNKRPINIITVSEEVKKNSLKALQTMLEIS